jgi:hypothetical protein
MAIRRRLTRRRLTLSQIFHLSGGDYGGAYSDAFASEEERREAWEVHREYMMRGCRYGGRPAAWWDYEAPIARPADPNYGPAALWEANLLESREREDCERSWRAHFEQSFEPHFAICLGPGEWLRGEEARKHHWADYGIPGRLIRHWLAERRRREREIAKLQPGELRA